MHAITCFLGSKNFSDLSSYLVNIFDDNERNGKSNCTSSKSTGEYIMSAPNLAWFP